MIQATARPGGDLADGREGHRRGAGPPARRGPDRGRARARPDRRSRRLRPRRRAHRRLRRQVRHPRAERGLRRPSRRLEGLRRAHEGRDRRLRSAPPRSAGSPTASTSSRCTRSRASPPRRRAPTARRGPVPGRHAGGPLPGLPARHALERPEGDRGRAARRADRQRPAPGRTPATRRTTRRAPASPASPRTCSTRARRRAAPSRSARSCSGWGPRSRHRSDLDSTVVAPQRAQGQPRRRRWQLIADVVLEPVLPRRRTSTGCKKQQLAAIEQERVRPNAMAHARAAGARLRGGPRLRQPADRLGHRGHGRRRLTREDAARWHAHLVQARQRHARRGRRHDASPRSRRSWRRPSRAGAGGTAPKKNVAAVAADGAERRLPPRPPGRAAVGHRGRPRRPAPGEPAGDPPGGREHGPRRPVHLAHQHEPARGQALDLRRPHPPRGRPRPARLRGHRPGADATRRRRRWRRSARSSRASGARGPSRRTSSPRAQNALTLTLPGRWETAGAVAGSLGEIVRFGFDDRYYDGYAAKVRAVTLADAAEAAQLVQPDKARLGDRGRPREDRAGPARARARRGEGDRRGRQCAALDAGQPADPGPLRALVRPLDAVAGPAPAAAGPDDAAGGRHGAGGAREGEPEDDARRPR